MLLNTLIATAAMLTAPQDPFKAGDVIVWKSEKLMNKKSPSVLQPIVVTRVHDTPLVDREEGAGSPYFNEPLDIAALFMDADGDLLELHYDSRRFRLATQEEINAAN